MLKIIEKLLELQDKDIRIFNLRKQIESVPVEKEKVMQVQHIAEAGCEKVKGTVLELEKKVKDVEIEIATQKDKIQNLQTKSAAIKKNDEYKAMLTEVDQLNKKIGELEDTQLEYWEALEVAKTAMVKEKKALEAAKARIESAVKDFEVRSANCREKIEKVSQERALIANEIPRNLLQTYKKIINNRATSKTFRKALVPLQNENCGSCFLKVTPQIKNRVRKAEIVTCEQCGALLYYE